MVRGEERGGERRRVGKSGVVRVNGVVDRVEEDKWRAMLAVDKAKLGELTIDD